MRALLVSGVFLLLGVLLVAPVAAQDDAPPPEASSAEPIDPLTALAEGNRLFRNGEYAAAVDTYRAGYTTDAPHPTLVYNLGTALHHLDRLPEAVLWYRRAGDSDDPWLEENLWLARRSLGSQIMPSAGLAGHLARHGTLLRGVAVILAWGAFAMILLWRDGRPPWVLPTAFALTLAVYMTAVGAEHWGPKAAVLLEECRSGGSDLPAGTEAWVRPLDDGTFRLAGTEVTCPESSVGLVAPKG